MTTKHSEKLFKAARQLLPGGVNSPVRAFQNVGGVPRFIASAHGAYRSAAESDIARAELEYDGFEQRVLAAAAAGRHT